MRTGKVTAAAAFLCAAALFSGCVRDISQTLPAEVTAVEVLATGTETETTTEKTTAETTTASSAETTTTTTETKAPETTETETSASSEDTTAPPEPEYPMYSDTYKEFILTEAYKEFLSECVFVGDSICSGLKAYEILPADSVVAVGNVAARNIFEDWVEFRIHGEKMTLIPALVDLKPKYIIFSMGMNDVNLTSEQTFCDNYDEILSQVHSFVPDAKLIVCSVTPVTFGTSGTLFTSNDNIDSFNRALQAHLDSAKNAVYADIAHELKNSHNRLKDNYLGSDDGVHLAPDAYYAILYQICEQIVDGKVYDPDTGTYIPDAAPVSETETSSVTEEALPDESGETDDGDDLSGTLHISDEE